MQISILPCKCSSCPSSATVGKRENVITTTAPSQVEKTSKEEQRGGGLVLDSQRCRSSGCRRTRWCFGAGTSRSPISTSARGKTQHLRVSGRAREKKSQKVERSHAAVLGSPPWCPSSSAGSPPAAASRRPPTCRRSSPQPLVILVLRLLLLQLPLQEEAASHFLTSLF